jgi:N-methylhydantoinase B
MRRIGRENIADGDIYITNDPWEGTGHLHDITMVTPSFHHGRLMGFFACTAHVVDIGGRGFGADGASVYKEGIYIPIMKFSDRGTVNETLLHILRGNVGEPEQLIGDIYALATCNDIGHRRLVEMIEEFGLNDLDGIAGFIFDNSRRATLDRISDLPRRTASGEMTIDGYSAPITIRVAVTIEADHTVSDFAGTSGIDPKGINCPLVYTKAYACYALKCAIAPEIPNNAASLAPFDVRAEENTIVHVLHPAPVALRHIVGHFVPDVVCNALDQLLPERVPTEGAGCLSNFQLSLRPRKDAPAKAGARRAEVLKFNSGGSGARPALERLNATAFPSGVMTMPVEATEHAGPLVIWRKELRPDSGSAGPAWRFGRRGDHHRAGRRHRDAWQRQAIRTARAQGPAGLPRGRRLRRAIGARRCAGTARSGARLYLRTDCARFLWAWRGRYCGSAKRSRSRRQRLITPVE